MVILLKFDFLLLLSQEYARLGAAVETRSYHMRFSFLFYSHAAIVAWHKQRVTVFADLAFKFQSVSVFLRPWLFFGRSLCSGWTAEDLPCTRFLGLLKENLNALFGYLLCGGVHL